MKTHSKRSLLFYLVISLLLILCITVSINLFFQATTGTSTFKFNQNSIYWPTNGWKLSKPEKQGMDSAMLVKLFDEIEGKSPIRKLKHKIRAKIKNEPERDSLLITSLLIIRNGFIVVEAYSTYDKEATRPLESSTKSLTSAILGIALSQRYIESVDQPVFDFFPELKSKNTNSQKHTITIKHLLTMSSGLKWPEWEMGYANPSNPIIQMMLSENWIKFILSKPVTKQPGSEFNYNSGCSYLLFAVLNQTGLNVADFAQKYLFTPMGIPNDKYIWSKGKNGIPNGAWGLRMRSRDMAKFGYLYLKGGFWDGQQIVPKKWVEESTKKHISIPGVPGLFIDHYGYQWYIHSFGFHSLGRGGQYIFVIPNLEIVVVLTSALASHETLDPIDLVRQFIIPSAKATNPLPDNLKAMTILEDRIKEF